MLRNPSIELKDRCWKLRPPVWVVGVWIICWGLQIENNLSRFLTMGFVCLKTEISSYHYPSGGEEARLGRAGQDISRRESRRTKHSLHPHLWLSGISRGWTLNLGQRSLFSQNKTVCLNCKFPLVKREERDMRRSRSEMEVRESHVTHVRTSSPRDDQYQIIQ